MRTTTINLDKESFSIVEEYNRSAFCRAAIKYFDKVLKTSNIPDELLGEIKNRGYLNKKNHIK